MSTTRPSNSSSTTNITIMLPTDGIGSRNMMSANLDMLIQAIGEAGLELNAYSKRKSDLIKNGLMEKQGPSLCLRTSRFLKVLYIERPTILMLLMKMKSSVFNHFF